MIAQSDTQCKMIIDYLKTAGSITPLDALEDLGCFRLSARIHELRQKGFDIVTVRERRNGKVYARYVWRRPR